MQMFENLPWYGYIMLVVAIGSYVFKFLRKGKEALGLEAELFDAKFRKVNDSSLTQEQLFAISLDAVITEYWKVDTNTLDFRKVEHFNDYLEGWGIDTKEGYWNLTNYFIEDGRRWYFDFIFNMIKNEPQENWDSMMYEKFGDNERAKRYFDLLKSGKALKKLKQNGFITFDSEIEKGVTAYDASILVGHARRAYSASLISKEEAWKVINFAMQLAKNDFSSWEEFGKSYILGFTLDIKDRKDGYHEEHYHMFKQVVENPESPWNNIEWKN